MDIKRLLTTALFVGAVMLLMNMFLKGNGGAAAGAPGTLHAFNYYQNMPKFKAPEDFRVREQDAVPATRVIGSVADGAPTKLSITVSNITAGIDQVQLRDYREKVGSPDRLTLIRSDPDLAKPFATIGIHIRPTGAAKEIPYGIVHTLQGDKVVDRPATPNDDAETIALANASNILDTQYVWKIENATDAAVTMSITFQLDGKPYVKVLKKFEITPNSYDVTISHAVQNFSNSPVDVSIDQLGAAELSRDDPSMDDRFFMAMRLDTSAMYVNDKKHPNVTHQELPKALGGWLDHTTGAYHDVGTMGIDPMNNTAANPLLWVAASNRFFTSIVRPTQESTSADTFTLSAPAGTILKKQHHVDYASLDLMHVNLSKPAENVAVMRFRGAMLTIPPATAADQPGTIIEPLSAYLGPKAKGELEGSLTAPAAGGAAPTPGTPTYDHAAYLYEKVVQFNTCYVYSFCVFDGVVYAILHLLDFFAHYVTFGNYGLAIMLLVIVVRAALHPLTRASQVNMAKMGKQMREVQPKIDAIKKKFADNREKQSQELMRIYRENNINPAGGILGCLPMMLQLPIWAALMSGLRLDIDLRQQSFIPGWINDLSNPDMLFPPLSTLNLAHPLITLPIVNFPIYGFNPLPILLAVVLFINMKVTMASQPKPADEQQAQMQKWSQYSIFMLPFFLYNAPSGSNLYFFASTMGGLVDTYFIRKSLKKRGILPPSAKDFPVEESSK